MSNKSHFKSGRNRHYQRFNKDAPVYPRKPSRKGLEENEIDTLKAKYDDFDSTKVTKFVDFPLSGRTLRGLKDCGYTTPTEIQKETIGLALKGLPILGDAKTGSGKTLAFIIPMLECLYVNKWTNMDGLGALVITPTRELAYQIFETLKKVGKYHQFSAGLIIGGKDLWFERKRMDQCNIMICTPGRLLQHMDENPLMDCINLKMLVLDEADRCLDMKFEEAINAIVTNLPTQRQTLLFSATQTRSVKELLRLDLEDPVYVSVHENSQYSTPEGLTQSYTVCELHDKINVIWSFIKHHRKKKILVFMSTCKQVKYIFEVFCRMRPGVSLLALYGSLHQLKRMAIYDSFCRKENVVLFATDVAARGLDFPAVDWVVQLDCPEDTSTYIHRAGRTARFNKGGEGLLVMIPSEEDSMVELLEKRRIPLEKINVNSKQLVSIQRPMEALLARDLVLKASAQRAFVAYVKSVLMMKDKSVFDVTQLDTDKYARSLGLANSPRIRILEKREKQKVKNQKKKEISKEDFIQSEEEESEDTESEEIVEQQIKQKTPKEFNFGLQDDDVSEEEEDLLKVRREDHAIDDSTPAVDVTHTSKKQQKKLNKVVTKEEMIKKLKNKKIVLNKKVVFDEGGQAMVDNLREKVSEMAKSYEEDESGGIDIEKVKMLLKEEDKADKMIYKEKVKAKHKEARLKSKKNKRPTMSKVETAMLGGSDESGSEEYEPDLDWLPDPDEWTNKKPESESDEDSRLTDSSTKRKKKNEKKSAKKMRMEESSENENDEVEDNGLTLMDDEELALQLLSNSNR